MVQNLLAASKLITAGSESRTDLVRHQQFVGTCQLFRQQPIKLIFEAQRPWADPAG